MKLFSVDGGSRCILTRHVNFATLLAYLQESHHKSVGWRAMIDTIWSHLFKKRQGRDEEICEILEATPLFQGLSRKDIRQVLQIVHERQFEADEIVFATGEPGMGVYIVAEGEVGVFLVEERSLRRAEIQVATLKAGELFGDATLFGHLHRSATIRAMRPSTLLGFLRTEFVDFIHRYPSLGTKLLSQLLSMASERLQHTNQQLLHVQEELEQAQRLLRDAGIQSHPAHEPLRQSQQKRRQRIMPRRKRRTLSDSGFHTEAERKEPPAQPNEVSASKKPGAVPQSSESNDGFEPCGESDPKVPLAPKALLQTAAEAQLSEAVVSKQAESKSEDGAKGDET